MTCVRPLAALVAILPLVAAQSAVGAPPAPATSVSGLNVTPEAVNPSDFSDAEYKALAAVHRQTPQYSLEQMASFVCSINWSRDTNNTVGSKAAFDATKTFEDTKDSERAGRTGLDALVRADEARQAAVQHMMANMRIPVQHDGDIGETTAGNLTIEDVTFRFGNLGGKSIIRLHGQLRNAGTRSEPVPHLMATALDHFGIVLAQESYRRFDGGQKVPAGGVFPFDVIFHDGPQYTREVKVTFSGRRSIRNRRDCGVVKPFKAPGQTLDVPRSQDAAQAALEDVAASPLQAEMVSARSVKTDAGRVLRVTGSIRNTSTKDAKPSRLTIFIRDAEGHAIGEAEPGLEGIVHGGDAAPFDLVVKDFQWASPTKGEQSLDEMKTVSVLVE